MRILLCNLMRKIQISKNNFIWRYLSSMVTCFLSGQENDLLKESKKLIFKHAKMLIYDQTKNMSPWTNDVLEIRILRIKLHRNSFMRHNKFSLENMSCADSIKNYNTSSQMFGLIKSNQIKSKSKQKICLKFGSIEAYEATWISI